MKPEMILKADVLDILFEERNKDYGAYTLRRDYNNRLLQAVLIMLGAVMIFVIINFLINSIGSPSQGVANPEPDKTVRLTSVLIPTEPQKVTPVVKQQVATVDYTKPVIVKETEEVFTEVKELEQDVQIGSETKQGIPASEATPENKSEGTGSGAAPVPPAMEEPPVYETAEVMPAFPGGNEALKRYLIKNLRFDFEDQEPGTRIEIRCRFIVDKEGKVAGVEIVKSAGRNSYDKEVTRVVNKMPDWLPGSQKGKPVAVYFTLPVIVEVPEQ